MCDIFERKTLSEDDTTVIYSYTPIEVSIGYETTTNDTTYFISKYVKALKYTDLNNESGFDFTFMGDIDYLPDKYVYGFPVLLDSNNRKDWGAIKRSMISIMEDLKEFKIVHGINKADAFSKMFLIYDDYNVSIDAKNLYDIFNLLYDITIDKNK